MANNWFGQSARCDSPPTSEERKVEHHHTHYHTSDPIFEGTRTKLNYIIQRIDDMADQFDELRTSVSNLTELSHSAVALLKGLSDKLSAAQASTDVSGSIASIKADLDADAADLAAALAANTPVATATATDPAAAPAADPAAAPAADPNAGTPPTA